VSAEFQNGATIIIEALHRQWKPVRLLCARLERDLCDPVQATAYLTPPGHSAHRLHYDTHDVFILQVEGRKRWRIGNAATRLPLPHQTYDRSAQAAPDVFTEVVLEAGDLLYLPRGFLHSAETAEEHSLHVTLGILTTTWHDLMRAYVKAAAAQLEALRMPLPDGYAITGAGSEAVICRTMGIVDQIAQRQRVEAVMKELPWPVRTSHRSQPLVPPSWSRLNSLVRVDCLHLDTPLFVSDHAAFDVRDDEESLVITVYGTEIELPGFVRSTVADMIARNRFCLNDLHDGLDDESKLVLARRLLREGALRLGATADDRNPRHALENPDE
jgi:hypothetical protein